MKRSDDGPSKDEERVSRPGRRGLQSPKSFGVQRPSSGGEQHPALKTLSLSARQAQSLKPPHRIMAVRLRDSGLDETPKGSRGSGGGTGSIGLQPMVLGPGRTRSKLTVPAAGVRAALPMRSVDVEAKLWRRSQVNGLINRWLAAISLLLSVGVFYQVGHDFMEAYQSKLVVRQFVGTLDRLVGVQQTIHRVAGHYAGASFALERHMSPLLLQNTRVLRIESADQTEGFMVELCLEEGCVLRDVNGTLHVDVWAGPSAGLSPEVVR